MSTTPPSQSPVNSSDTSPPLPSTNLPFNPRHMDEVTFRMLNGEIEEPSRFLQQNVSDRVLTLIEWCDLMLSPEERRVACPGEIKSARQGRLHSMRSLWAQRLASEQSSVEIPHSSTAERNLFKQLLHAIKDMTIVYSEPCNETRIDNDLATLAAPTSASPITQTDADAHGSHASAATVVPARTSTPTQTNNALILQVQDFLSRTESFIVRADAVHAENTTDRNAISKVRRFLVNMGRDVVNRCRQEGINAEQDKKNKGKAVAGDQLLQPHTYQPTPAEAAKPAMPKADKADKGKKAFTFNPEVTAFQPRCVPLNVDMIANPANYHTCGCSKQKVVRCEYCNEDAVFCDPYIR